MSANIVDSEDSVRALVEKIEKAPAKPFIFVDLEGVNLSRHGSIAIMQMLLPPSPIVHLIDVFLLQKAAFETTTPGGQTLKDILESSNYVKIFFDVRNDSDALYSHFQIRLQGVIDLQLVEFASRPGQGRFVRGLAKCISEDAQLDWRQSEKWKKIKEDGQRLFDPEKGGRYEVFFERPLPAAIKNYCVQDVLTLPHLLLVYGRRINPHVAIQVHAEGLRRIELSQSRNFNGKGRHMAVGPIFTLERPRIEPSPDFPLSVICSEAELITRCFLDEDKPVTSPTLETAVVVESSSGDDAAALTEDLESLQIGDSTSGWTSEPRVADRYDGGVEVGE